ncbi:unnamed protein product [Brassica oleracea var. botrytis]
MWVVRRRIISQIIRVFPDLNVRCRWKLWLQVTVGRNEEWSDNIGCLFGAFIGGRHVMMTGERRVHRSTQNEKQREAVSLSS